MAWSEGCGVTGLELKDGEVLQAVLLDSSNPQREGPAAAWGALRTCSVPLKYDGDTDGYHVAAEEAEQTWRRQLFYALAGVRDPDPTGLPRIHNDRFPGHLRLWFGGGDAIKFTAELPRAERDSGKVGAVADAGVKALREAMLEYCGSDQIEARPREAKLVFRDVQPQHVYVQGMPPYLDVVPLAVESRHHLDWFLTAWRESYVLLHGLYEARRPLTPACNSGPPEGGHRAAGELARYTRRKAIHAGFNTVDE